MRTVEERRVLPGATIAGLVWLPVGLVGVPIGWYWARGGVRQQRAETGAVIALVGAVVFVVLVVVAG